MGVSRPVRAVVGLFLLWALGCGLFGVHLLHLVQPEENARAFVYGIGFPMALSLSLLGGSTWIWHKMDAKQQFIRVVGWSLVGGAILAVAAIFVILYQHTEGVLMSHPLFVVANATTGGAAVGVVVGFYDYRRRVARRRESRAHERTTRLNHQLSVVNRVLRHDLRNRASTIQTRIDLCEEESDVPRAHADAIRQQVTELTELSDRMSEIGTVLQAESDDRQVVDLPRVVRNACQRVRESYPEVSIEVSLPDSQPVHAHPAIDTAIESLVENAVEHNDTSTPRVEIDHERHENDGTTYLEMTIADNGPGIPASEEAVLERGYETPLEHSNGLGLWLVHWVVGDSDGDVWFETAEPTGSVVGIRLRCATQAT